MRHGDSLRLSLRKLRQRWGRALFAVLVLAIALVPPILVVDLLDGATAVITSSAKARGQDPRRVRVWRKWPYAYQAISLTQDDLELVHALPGLVSTQIPLAISSAYLRLGEHEIISRVVGETEDFVRHLTADGQSFESVDDVVPVLVGKLSLIYRRDSNLKIVRQDRDLDAIVGQVFELHVGDILQPLRNGFRIRNPRTGEYRPATKAEWDARAEQISTQIGARYNLDSFDRELIVRARIAGVIPGRALRIPYKVVERFRSWLDERAESSQKRTAVNKRSAREELDLLFATDEAARVATETLRAAGLIIRSYHATVQITFDAIRQAVYVVGGVVGVILLLACFMVSSVLARVILDATQEIGLLRALGARQSHVLRIYMYEAGLLCALGSGLGIIVGNTAAAGISYWVLESAKEQTLGIEILGQHIRLNQIDLLPTSLWRFAPLQLLWIGLAVSLAMLSAWIPARRSIRLDPTRALQST